MSRIVCDASNTYECLECGHRWRSSSRLQWWPIRLRWNWAATPRRFFGYHGWQTGWDGPEQRVFGHTFHVGPLKICLGKDIRNDRLELQHPSPAQTKEEP